MTTQSRSFTPSLIDPAPTAPSAVATITSFIAQIPLFVRARLRIWKIRFDDRAYLAGLQHFQLSEMGMTLGQRAGEINKPFWKE